MSNIAVRLRAIADEVQALENPAPPPVEPPAPEPPPAPPPVEPPAPEPDPLPGLTVPQLQSRQLNLGAVLQFRDWNNSRYDRNIAVPVFNPLKSQIDGLKMSYVGPTPNLSAALYHLTVDGVRVASAEPYGTDKIVKLKWTNVDLSGVGTGWRLLEIEPDTPTNETCHPWWVYVSQDGSTPVGDFAPSQTGSYGIVHENGSTAIFGKSPLTIDPPKFKLEPRECVPFDFAAKPEQMYRRNLVPYCEGDPPYLRTMEDGRRTTNQFQAYKWTQVIGAAPDVLLRDGPFGVGTLSGPTHVEVGLANIAEIGGYVDNVYFCDSWSFGKIRYIRGQASNSGEIVRLAGYRHTSDGLQLIGNWDSIPQDRRGFRELWGCAWDTRTQVTDETADPIPAEKNLRPHITGIALWLPDSQHNRIAHLKFDPRSHATPPVVTEFATELNDPWDCVFDGQYLIVSERQANRVIALDPDTGAYVKTILQGEPLAAIGNSRTYNRLASLDAMRAAPTVLPEGMFLLDRWLYVGSGVARQIVRVHLDTGAYEVCCNWDASDTALQALFCKFAVSDGSFGPKGTMFMSLWDVATNGYPRAFLPDGTQWHYTILGSAQRRGGLGGKWDGLGYSCAVGVSRGRLIAGGAKYGLAEISLGKPGDITVDDKLYSQGKDEYEANGGRLRTGVDGFRQWKDVPLPWGKSDAVDYFLTVNGHTKD